MYNNYAILKFREFLDSISIDIWFALLHEEFKEEYYMIEELPSREILPYIEEDGEFAEGGIFPGEKIWAFGFNQLSTKDFFEKYSSLEKNLIYEMTLNRKTATDDKEVDSIYKELFNWLNDRVTGIQYKQEKDLFECNYAHNCELFDKIKFKKKYETEVQEFYKELKNRLLQTYSFVVEISTPSIIKSNLLWDKPKIDLIELMAALVESKSIKKDGIPVTKEYMVEFFSQIFTNVDLKDFYKDLGQATRRKKDKARYLSSLVKTFVDYSNNTKETSK
jgi:hypothetical protein